MKTSDVVTTPTLGWRAYLIKYCTPRTRCTPDQHPHPRYGSSYRWTLAGMFGQHMHEAGIPPAECGVWPSIPELIDPKEQYTHVAPADGCSDGYYVLIDDKPWWSKGIIWQGNPAQTPYVWAYVQCLGAGLLHARREGEEVIQGYRVERYRLIALYWPCIDEGFTTLWPEGYQMRAFYTEHDEAGNSCVVSVQMALGDVLDAIGSGLGVEIIKRPLAEILA